MMQPIENCKPKCTLNTVQNVQSIMRFKLNALYLNFISKINKKSPGN